VGIFPSFSPARETECSAADQQVIADARRIVGEPEDSNYVPVDAHEFCGRIFHSCFMGTENSSKETRKRAKDLSAAIGRYSAPMCSDWTEKLTQSGNSYHTDFNMDLVVTAVRDLFARVTNIKPKFKVHGGSQAENLALQNIQVGHSTL